MYPEEISEPDSDDHGAGRRLPDAGPGPRAGRVPPGAGATAPDTGAPATLWTPSYLRLVGMMAAIGFSFSLFFLLPKYLAIELHGTPSGIGLVMAAFGIASVLVIPLLGRIGDRLGRRGSLVAANVTMAVAAGGFALTSQVGVLAVALRGLQGVAWAVGFSTAMALVSELAPADRLAQAIGFSGAASLAMNALAPAIGEPLAARFGHRPVFLLATVTSLAGVALARRLSLPAGVSSGATAAGAKAAARPGAGAAVPALDGRGPLLVVFGQAGLAFGVLFTFLAPFALQHRVTAVRPFFMAYTLAALAVRIVGSRLADGVGHRKVAAVALAMYGAVVAATGIVGPTWLLAIGVSFGVAHGAVFPAAMALLLEGTEPRRRTRLIGLANGAMSLGQVTVFPAGVLAEHAGYPVVFIAAGAATMASATLLLGTGRRRG